MPRNQNPDSSPADTIQEGAAPKPRSFGVNHFHLVGRMTDAGTLRQTPSGKSVLHFSIAVTGGGATTFLDLSPGNARARPWRSTAARAASSTSRAGSPPGRARSTATASSRWT